MSDAAKRQIAALLALAGEDKGRAIVAELAAPQVLRLFDREAANLHARKLLADGLTRRAAAYRLAARYDISLKSAYRRISDALQAGPRQ